jgi:hypothetical protein
VFVDGSTETGAVNQRRLCFAYTNVSSGFEVNKINNNNYNKIFIDCTWFG